MKTEQEILSVAIVTSAGGKVYSRADVMPTGTVDRIVQKDLHFQGDPYSHYVGLDKDGGMLFSINCYVPCVVEYSNP